MSDISIRVRSVIAEQADVPRELAATNTRLDDLDLTSLDFYEIAQELEDEFDIAIDDSTARSWIMVGDVVLTVEHATDVRPASVGAV